MKAKILIVDDILQNIQIVGKILTDTNYNISYATDGAGALKKTKHIKFDLILLDIMMPEMDGYELCKKLKTNDKTKDIPIIFVTAKTDAESIIQGFLAGAQDFVSKPFQSQELLARIKTHLKLKFQSEELKKTVKELSIKNENINSSIRYAKTIQSALLPDIETIKNDFRDFFLLYKPRSIVSGDFYWYHKIKDLQIYIIADCTGHGVPGAMLSIAGKAFLDQIIKFDFTTQTDEILNKLDRFFSYLMNNAEFDLTDGMDISVFSYNPTKKQVQFSSAGHSLLYFKDNQGISIEGNMFSIGGYDQSNNTNFTKHTIEISKNSSYKFYMYSDGFADQLGGKKIKRFTTESLHKLISEHIDKPMQKQKELFNKTLLEWINNYKQIDDITLTGFFLPE
jgi:CheY-like chemotaxis protein